MVSGFCGQYLTCEVTSTPGLSEDETVRSWGEFVACGADEEHLPGAELTLDDAYKKERNRQNPLRPWIRGEVSDDDSKVTIVFNRQLLGWHYQWASTKHTCDAFHTYKAHIFILNQKTGMLRYIGSIMSPQFQLYSRRRQALMNEQHQAHIAARASLAIALGDQAPDEEAADLEETKPIRVPPRTDSGVVDNSYATMKQTQYTAMPFESRSGKPTEVCAFVELATKHKVFEKCLKTERDAAQSVVYKRKKRKLDPVRWKKRQQRSLILDRLMRFLLMHSGQGGIYDTRDAHSFASGARLTMSGEGGNLDDFSQSLMISLIGDSGNNKNISNLDFDLMIDSTLEHDGSISSENSAKNDDCASISASVASAAVDESQDLLERLRTLLVTKGSPETRAKVDHLVKTTERLGDAIIAVSSNRSDFINFINRWKSPEGVERMKKQFEKEKNSKKKLTGFVNEESEEEDEGEDMSSIYSEIRGMFRHVVLEALGSLGGDLDSFEEAMELAAKYHILQADPFYPPSKRVAAMTHLQLYGNLHAFKQQDFGSRKGKFRDEQQRVDWVDAYWKLRRKMFRRIVISRIVDERRGISMPENALPIEPQWDVNGTWYNCTAHERSKLMMQLAKKASGISMGELSARLFESMWRRIHLTINKEALHVQGEKVLLANPSTVYFLDKKSRSFTMANPLPMNNFALQRQYVAWTSTTETGNYVNILTGGKTRARHIDAFAKFGKDAIGPTDIEIDHTRDSEMRIAKRISLTPDGETLFVDHRVHFFEEKTAPSFDDFDSLPPLFRPGRPSEVGYFCAKYIKVYDGPDYNDELLDLL
eukprot:CAMPEP_0203759254 /NCGR_PEP_ID=MMETSP0098-20131031/12208_1 /ASSEMBLY_ACC=CAM_ASM_000208 /TAXON_ID=96639 /ORGANISM=" , Strain NY0313808BC1" /LENGTH=819 /DNA_ID=CAMNT_0050652073 /DNA_START=516 /DNA_END=2975 /DNA_ORIENTATION=+